MEKIIFFVDGLSRLLYILCMKVTTQIAKLTANDLMYVAQHAPQYQATVYVNGKYFFAGDILKSKSAAEKNGRAIKKLFKNEIKTAAIK